MGQETDEIEEQKRVRKHAPYGSKSHVRSDAKASRRESIVRAARELYNEKGLEHTSIKDIANRVGVTRSLFYHYFPNKQSVTAAVFDMYTDELTEDARIRYESLEVIDLERLGVSAVTNIRNRIENPSSLRRALYSNEAAGLYIDLLDRTADKMATLFVNELLPRCVYRGASFEVPEDIHERIYMLYAGTVGLIHAQRGLSNQALVSIGVGAVLSTKPSLHGCG
ncbi:TetR/AcrR family transcriptional regulator [Slackia heliotrinireducens]|uniref:TetR/AcrR family transcriptional regulator n=1 Tax=Slackia heliotrinireducens TaxID=84110 RepID=UPI003315310C